MQRKIIQLITFQRSSIKVGPFHMKLHVTYSAISLICNDQEPFLFWMPCHICVNKIRLLLKLEIAILQSSIGVVLPSHFHLSEPATSAAAVTNAATKLTPVSNSSPRLIDQVHTPSEQITHPKMTFPIVILLLRASRPIAGRRLNQAALVLYAIAIYRAQWRDYFTKYVYLIS